MVIPRSKVVLVAIQDEGSRFARPVYSALRRLGARGRLLTGFRHSFALVGHAGRRKPRWVRHVQRPRYRGPSVISTTITLSGGDYYSHISRLTLVLHRITRHIQGKTILYVGRITRTPRNEGEHAPRNYLVEEQSNSQQLPCHMAS